MKQPGEPIKGRGAQMNTHNPFLKRQYTLEHLDVIEEPLERDNQTQFLEEHPKNIISKNDSPDINFSNSINPYQGCEHGCTYCYARNTHQYWGFSAGLDFERKVMVKLNAPELLRKALDKPSYKVDSIILSGNTDPYQPAERKYRLTRQILEIMREYNHPVGIITKNSLILRDIELLASLAADGLAHVNVSITTLNEELRQKMEPRTTTATQRLRVIEKLSARGVPVNVMTAPLVPSINDHEVPAIIKAAAERGAVSAGYTFVRLNGAVADIFRDWLQTHFPDRVERVMTQVIHGHGGQPGDSRWGVRMRGQGQMADTISGLFHMARQKYMAGRVYPPYNLSLFKRPQRGQLSLF